MAAAALLGVSAGASILGGMQQKAALKSEAKALEFQKRAEALRGKQISAMRRAELNEALGTIDTIRVERGLDLDSPGAFALRDRTRKTAADNENAEVLSSKFREVDLATQAAARRRAAPFAMIGGFANAAGTLASFAKG